MLDILKAIFATVLFGAFFLLLMMGLSKLFNSNLVDKRGQTMASPDDLDDLIRGIKKGGVKLYEGTKTTTSIIKSKLQNKNEIEKLATLAQLKEKGSITTDEYEKLKNELLRNI